MAEIDHSVYFGLMLEDGSGDTGNVDWETGGTKSVDGNTKYAKYSLIHETGGHEYRGLAKGVNTWTDWHLIPASRPEISPPEVYTNYVELPGCHGKLDLSEYLTGYPVYRNRSGSLEFIAANGHGFWAERYNQICNFLHGKKLFMVLYDEPEYFYTGRFRVQKWNSDGKTNWSTITIDYELDPFKFVLPRASFDDYWDRFLLSDIWTYESMTNIDAANANSVYYIPGYTNGFMLDGFINDNSSFPASANVTVNDQQVLTLTRNSRSESTRRSWNPALLPFTSPNNKVTVSGTGNVNLFFWGGHL